MLNMRTPPPESLSVFCCRLTVMLPTSCWLSVAAGPVMVPL